MKKQSKKKSLKKVISKRSKNVNKLTVVNHAASSIIKYIKDFGNSYLINYKNLKNVDRLEKDIRGLIKLSLLKYDCDIFPDNEYHNSQEKRNTNYENTTKHND
jgi:hypothetical protein